MSDTLDNRAIDKPVRCKRLQREFQAKEIAGCHGRVDALQSHEYIPSLGWAVAYSSEYVSWGDGNRFCNFGLGWSLLSARVAAT